MRYRYIHANDDILQFNLHSILADKGIDKGNHDGNDNDNNAPILYEVFSI